MHGLLERFGKTYPAWGTHLPRLSFICRSHVRSQSKSRPDDDIYGLSRYRSNASLYPDVSPCRSQCWSRQPRELFRLHFVAANPQSCIQVPQVALRDSSLVQYSLGVAYTVFFTPWVISKSPGCLPIQDLEAVGKYQHSSFPLLRTTFKIDTS
jgi:hypothetical protein